MFYFYNTKQANWIMIYNRALIITSFQQFVEILQIRRFLLLNFKVELNKALTYLLKRKTTIMIVMATISNNKPPPPAAPAITIFVFHDEPATVGTSSA